MKYYLRIAVTLLLALVWHQQGLGWVFFPLDEANAFITRWRGTSGTPIMVSLIGKYSYSWEKSDGTVIIRELIEVKDGQCLLLPVDADGDYVLKAGPIGVQRITFESKWDLSRESLLVVEQWGRVAWTSFQDAFYGCSNMNIAAGAGLPDLRGVKSMDRAFKGCEKLNARIGDWDVSNVTSMESMFSGCSAFNQPLKKWNVSRVTSMKNMFHGCSSFNQPLGEWTPSEMLDLGLYSSGLSAENYSSTLVAWAAKKDQLKRDVEIDATGLLFNGKGKDARQQLIDAKGWKFEGDTGVDPAQAFITRWKCKAGDRIRVPLYGRYPYSWEKADGTLIEQGISHGTDLLVLEAEVAGEYVLKAGPAGVRYIQFGVYDFNCECYKSVTGTPLELQQVEQWGSVKWETFGGAFYGCENVRISDGAGKPDLSKVESMESAFENCKQFNSPIADWDVLNVTDMKRMFSGCSSFNQPLDKWDVSNVENMESMFSGCGAFNQPLDKWDVSKVLNMRGMFSRCGAFNQPLEKWDVSKVTRMSMMFYGCSLFNQPLEKWNVSKVKSMYHMFSGCSSFNQPLEKWDVSKVTDMESMFSGCSAFNQPLEKWDVSKVTDMYDMFEGCSVFNRPLGSWTLSALKRSLYSNELSFSGSGLSMENYQSTLEAWAGKRALLSTKVRVDATGLVYNAAGAAARQLLIDEKQWEFSGDIPELNLSDAFVTRWKGEVGKPIEVPLYGDYAYRWEKDDGTLVHSGVARGRNQGLVMLSVTEAGEYVLKAGPLGVKRLAFGEWHDSDGGYFTRNGTPWALLQVEQWGSVKWESFAGAFYGCENMNIAEGAGLPDLNYVQSMRSAFEGCASFNSPIGDWNVSGMRDMTNVLKNCYSYNQALGEWAISSLESDLGLYHSGLNVKIYSAMLLAWAAKKEELSRDVRVDAKGLKFNAEGYLARQQLIESKGWKFEGDEPVVDPTKAFITRWKGVMKQPVLVPLYGKYIYQWEKTDGTILKSGVATIAEKEMLALPVLEDGEYVLKVEPEGGLRIEFGEWNGIAYSGIRGTPRALLQVIQWGSPAWTSFAGAFRGCENMDIADGAGLPDLRGVQSMQSAFEECAAFNSPIGEWDVSSVTNMGDMFHGCRSFNQPLGKWNVSSVTNMLGMFYNCYSFNQPLEQWDVSNVKNMLGMFYNSYSFNQTLGNWSPSKLESLGLNGCGLNTENYSTMLASWAGKKKQLKRNVKVHASGLKYNSDVAEARQQLVATNGWHFDGDGEATAINPAVEIVNAPAELNVNTPYSFIARVLPAEAAQGVTWTVEEGEKWGSFVGDVLSAERIGYVTVTATAVEVPKPSRTVKIKVVSNVGLTGISVLPANSRLGVGDTLHLTTHYTPENATSRKVTWSSSDLAVASVDAQGVVLGKKEGTATITATSKDGEYTATCELTVVNPVPLKGIAMTPKNAKIQGSGTQQLAVRYTPEDATNRSVVWYSSDESVATVNASGTVKTVNVGTAVITATAIDGGYTASCVISVDSVALKSISLGYASIQLQAGSTQQLQVNYSPEDATNRTLRWSSSNTHVAIVNGQGVVRGVGGGTATITAESADEKLSATCEVTVTSVWVALDSITLPLAYTLDAGEIRMMEVGYAPTNATNRSVIWSSSNEAVASVDAEGRVTGKMPGTATITATAADGEHKASCEVTVLAPAFLTGIAVNPTKVRLRVGVTLQLKVSYTPADAPNKSVTWRSSDECVASVDKEGWVTAKTPGTAKITAKAADGGHTDTCMVTVMAYKRPSSVESALLAGVTVSPNPFDDYLIVQSAQGVIRYSLVNASGAEVLCGTHEGAEVLTLATSHLPAGIYWLRLSAADGDRTVQVIRH